MAEERLIDDDKDRKYRIRINENGEEELVIIKPEEQTEEEPQYFVPVFDGDDEEAAVMTPEQLLAREKARGEEAARRQKLLAEKLGHAQRLFDGEDYGGALYTLEEAEEYGESGGLYCLKLRALTRDFSDFSAAEECRSAADGVRTYATAEEKDGLKPLVEPVKEKLSNLEAEIEELNAENEQKKSERREAFTAKYKRSLAVYAATLVPFVVLLTLALVFGMKIHETKDNYTNLILTAVFAAAAGINFIVVLITLRRLVVSIRRVKLNENNSSTRLGRQLEECREKAALLTRIYMAVNGVYDGNADNVRAENSVVGSEDSRTARLGAVAEDDISR